MKNKYFYHYNFYDIENEPNLNKSSLVILKHFKTLQQQTEYTCGPRCIEMVLKYLFTDEKNCELANLDEFKISNMINTRPYPHGTKLKNMVNFFKKMNKNNLYTIISSIDFPRKENDLCFSDYKDFRNFVVSNLTEGSPIILENVDYGGHYKVLIGFDKLSDEGNEDILIFADPYDDTDGCQDGYNYFPASRFFYMWFDDHCLEKKYRKQPFIVIKKNK